MFQLLFGLSMTTLAMTTCLNNKTNRLAEITNSQGIIRKTETLKKHPSGHPNFL